jgi:DNA polymerase III delta prime subunit
MLYDASEYLWVEKYRPKIIDDIILPASLKSTFKDIINQGNIPNLLLSGTSGVGKTTIAKILCETLDCDYMIINASKDGNIDTLRNEIQNFASSVSFRGSRKYVILDESDNLNPNSTQMALRSFMEEFSINCGFIFTCNYKNKIIPAIHSRCSAIDFTISNQEKAKLASLFFKRTISILENENIKFDIKVVVELINKYFPDWRRIINELQMYSSSGVIDSGILSKFKDMPLKDLVSFMKEKNYTELRGWISENFNTDQVGFFRNFYENASLYLTTQSIPNLILLIAKYQFQAAFVADQQINFLAFLTECMIECSFL